MSTHHYLYTAAQAEAHPHTATASSPPKQQRHEEPCRPACASLTPFTPSAMKCSRPQRNSLLAQPHTRVRASGTRIALIQSDPRSPGHATAARALASRRWWRTQGWQRMPIPTLTVAHFPICLRAAVRPWKNRRRLQLLGVGAGAVGSVPRETGSAGLCCLPAWACVLGVCVG